MNRREKTLAILIAAILALLLIVVAVRYAIVLPLRQVDKKTAGFREKIAKIKAERLAFFDAEEQVKRWTQHSFAESVDQASAKSGEMLTQLILHSGLQEDEFTRLPVGPRKIKGAQEIGWNIQGEGPLVSVVNLLFLLQESPYLHRLEGLSVSPGERPGRVDVRFRYVTLVIDPAPIVDPITLAAKYTLGSPERKVFDSIIARDLLRPYIRRPPPPPTAPPGSHGNTAGALGPENFKIVDLSEWQGRTEIAVLDKSQQKTIRHRVGDPLAGGVVIMVDTRPLPRPDRAGVQSFARVIVQIGAEYWAIELGQTLAEKYKLAPEQLPEKLTRL
jgi:hypothetical protein